MSEIIVHKQAGEIGDALADVVASDPIKEKLKKPLQEIADMLTDEILYRTIEEMPEYFQDFVLRMAQNTVKAMLEGNEREMKRYLGLDGWTGRDKQHSVIHGKLSEHDPLLLRKKICEAHADLLKTERTLDLEDQVKSLVEQVNKLEMRNRELTEQLRDLRPVY